MSERLAAIRSFYARLTAAYAGVGDPRIVDVFAALERERFLGPGPWHIAVASGYISTQTDDPAVLYQDVVVGLVPEKGINNGEPTLHAKSLAAAAPATGDVVIHIGAGVGYYTAMLARLVGESGHVHAYEMEPTLASRATANLSDYRNVTIHAHSVFEEPLPEADVIYVNAGATHIPAPWLDALRIGARLILPLTPNERLGCMLHVTRLSAGSYAARIFSTAGFIPCSGGRDPQQSAALAAALDLRAVEEVRSLHRGSEPDETAWCVGQGWWLSTAEPS